MPSLWSLTIINYLRVTDMEVLDMRIFKHRKKIRKPFWVKSLPISFLILDWMINKIFSSFIPMNFRWYHKDTEGEWIWVYMGKRYCKTCRGLWFLLGGWACSSDCLWSEETVSNREDLDNQWNYSQPHCE